MNTIEAAAAVLGLVQKVWDETRMDMHDSFTIAGAPVRKTLDFTKPDSPDERLRIGVKFAKLHHWRPDRR